MENESDVLVSETSEFVWFEGEDVGIAIYYFAGVRFFERTDNLEQSSLASTAWTDDSSDFPVVYREINAFKDVEGVKTFSYFRQINHIFCEVTHFLSKNG